MLNEIPKLWIGILNTIYFPVTMVLVAKICSWIPIDRFHPMHFFYRQAFWEKNLWIYEKFFKIRLWKHRLPDGSKMLGGFEKKNLQRSDPHYMRIFLHETCRGEFVHWADLALLPLVLIWNPGWAIVVMVSLGVLGNLPCILVQRYNRIRLLKVLDGR